MLDDDSKILADLGFGGAISFSFLGVLGPTLIIYGVFAENETEVSFFSRELYEQYKAHPEASHLVSDSVFICNPMVRRSNGKANRRSYRRVLMHAFFPRVLGLST